MKKKLHVNRRTGFTLIEMLIASSLFAVIGTLALSFFVTLSRSSSTFTLRERALDDAQFIMNTLVREIAGNSIDYEEYYNRTVIGGEFGMNFGQYAARFYYSEDTPKGQKNNCDNQAKEVCLNVGKNPPREDILAGEGSAFMAYGQEIDAVEKSLTDEEKVFCKDFQAKNELKINKRNYTCVQHLYLISADGKTKTLIAPERFKVKVADGKETNAATLSRAQMTWLAKDKPGVYTCAENAICTQNEEIITMNQEKENGKKIPVTIPKRSDLSDALDDDEGQDFIPFTPKRINIKSIRFFISPVEDPLKAFSEGEDPLKSLSEKEVYAKYALHQPTVLIVMEVEPIENLTSGKTNGPKITLQKQVTTSVFDEVKSYPPRMECFPQTGDGCSAIRKQ